MLVDTLATHKGELSSFDCVVHRPDQERSSTLEAACGEIGRLEAVVWRDEGRVLLTVTFRQKRYYGRSLPLYIRPSPLRLLKPIDAAGIALGMRDSTREAKER